ncbi:MurR/RpiR family transcriptional regulator [Erysipelothrix sp. HDW6A]|uniref:MurR/RpiR family transcriptional regulator n=1 Tax=Erysipelothrix sp. HDW6A TaxID=2714928 RepID=UPI00140B7725|nr:MurR/RpiR family transcriptional regulator [Erysipelothrix sp. HDW6A]QIK57088.1 MurR/RpiR family transcriptional regulator [Erysipelothrix sp. HDW6A]
MLFLDYVPDLTDIEIEIYKFIESNINKIEDLSIRELAALTHVSTTTILRFCAKFETSGYSDFKSRLKYHSKNKNQELLPHSIDESSLVNFILKSSSSSFEKKLDEVAELLINKDSIYFVGYGTSNVVASYGAIYFSKLYSFAINLDFLIEHPVHKISKESAEKMCVIALSVSGESNRVLGTISHFVKNGVDVVSITNSSKCRLANISTINVPYYIKDEKIKTSDITSQVPAIFLIEKLAKKVANYKK